MVFCLLKGFSKIKYNAILIKFHLQALFNF
jgi:hypothetical protein